MKSVIRIKALSFHDVMQLTVLQLNSVLFDLKTHVHNYQDILNTLHGKDNLHGKD